jgi:hypothetical protein
MQEEFKCEYCDTVFKYKSNLKSHIKNTKFCLEIQKKIDPSIVLEIKKTDFVCEYCNMEFKSKRNLQTHITICKEKDIYDVKKELKQKHLEEIKILEEKHLNDLNSYKIIIASLEAKIEIYEKDHDIISDIAKQTKITNNTNTNNIVNNLAIYDINRITETFSNKLDYITKEDIINGQKGIANILVPCLYDENGNKMLTCTDKSRLMFIKLDDKYNRIKDSELKNLASAIKPLALKKADEIVEEHNKLKERIYNIDSLKAENKVYISYIKHFQEIINNSKNSNINSRMVTDYENKIREYEEIINRNQEIIDDDHEKRDIDSIEDENDKLIDGHTEIKYLDTENTKFARHMSKLL